MKSLHSVLKLLSREAGVQMCSVKKVFLEISQNSRENTFSKNTFSYRTPLVAASLSN